MPAPSISADRSQKTRQAALVLHDVQKSYSKKKVLESLTIEVPTGELFGIIGPDGAGKTTTMGILAGVLPYDKGEIKVLGKSALEARREIGYVTQEFSLYPELSIDENLLYVGGAHDLSADSLRERKKMLLEKMGLYPFRDRLAAQLSGGMKQKLALCCALIYEPELLLLDEPTVGVDPASRREFWDLLEDLKSDEVTVVVATPYYDEADRCDRVGLLFDGAMQVCGTPAKLKKDLKVERIELFTNDDRKAEELIFNIKEKEQLGLVDIYSLGDHLELLAKHSQETISTLKQALSSAQIKINDLKTGDPTIENVFMLRAIKHEMRDLESSRLAACLHECRKGKNDDVAIDVEHLSKKFGSFNAVRDVNLQIRYGEIFGLLGANGAGKTTTVQMLCGLQKPSSGSARLADESSNLRSAKLRKRIGYMSQKNTLYTDLTVRENLEFYSSAYGLSLDEREKMIKWALKSSDLEDRADDLIGSLPKGIRRSSFLTNRLPALTPRRAANSGQ
jgi:ABC-2 type transport system ATP-binding protein